MNFRFQLTPKRPLRSEVEREKRLSRPTSIIASNTSIRGNNTGDAISLSGESSNRNSIGNFLTNGSIECSSDPIFLISISVTTDSTASEDDSIPPPLPAKTRDSNDYSNLPPAYTTTIECHGNENYSIVTAKWPTKRALPAEPISIDNVSYEFVESRNSCMIDDKRRPPTPPPKPNRSSKHVPT